MFLNICLLLYSPLSSFFMVFCCLDPSSVIRQPLVGLYDVSAAGLTEYGAQIEDAVVPIAHPVEWIVKIRLQDIPEGHSRK